VTTTAEGQLTTDMPTPGAPTPGAPTTGVPTRVALRRIDLRGPARPHPRALRALLPRATFDVDAALATVRPICDAVRDRGADALFEFAERFDGVRPPSLRVPPEAITAAVEALADDVRAALVEAIRRARLVHADQRRTDTTTTVVPGGTVTERWVPVARVGLYVPGGLAVYPSSVVMNVVPAQAAGVGSLAVASPPQEDNGGLPDATILAACGLLGVDEVWAVGGAQAVALFAHGLPATGAADDSGVDDKGVDRSGVDDAAGCDPVDLVTGPGNLYVTAAKRLLRGIVGIDSEAGTTEIAVLADATADPRLVAADLLSQAEHDPAAASVLVTDSAELADAVDAELEAQAEATKHTERVRTALSGRQSGTVLVEDLEQGLQVVDAYAAEHLEVQTADAAAVAARVTNAGAVFVGPWSPVPLGDYAAGSNHVLPTGGAARHSSGLSVQTFLRGIHVVQYDAAALAGVADHVVVLAEAEDLPAHGAAIRVRSDNAAVVARVRAQKATAGTTIEAVDMLADKEADRR